MGMGYSGDSHLGRVSRRFTPPPYPPPTAPPPPPNFLYSFSYIRFLSYATPRTSLFFFTEGQGAIYVSHREPTAYLQGLGSEFPLFVFPGPSGKTNMKTNKRHDPPPPPTSPPARSVSFFLVGRGTRSISRSSLNRPRKVTCRQNGLGLGSRTTPSDPDWRRLDG